MAAGGNSFIRVRLYFDYPPPAVIDCRMCWLLVDLNKCRVVADLESIIKEKFEFGSRSILNLFIEDCYLPHTECIYVVRDNDSVRVKVDFVAQVNGHSSCPDASSKNCRKRQRPTEEEVDGPGGNGVSVEWKEKKRKKRSKESLEGAAKQASGDERKKKSQGKRTEKKRKKKTEEKIPAATPKPAASAKKTVKNTKKPPAAQAKTPSVSSSDSSSSSSEEDAAPKKPSALKAAPKTSLTTSASKPPPNTKPTQTKSHPTSSSSSETDSSSDEAPSVKTTAQSNPLSSTAPKSRINNNSKPLQAPSALPSTNCAQKQAPSITVAPGDKTAGPCDSDGEEEIELVIRKPVQPPGWGVGGRPSWRGCSRGRARRGGPGDRRGGEGKGLVGGQADSCEFSYNGAKEPCYQTDSLTNMSVVLQNGVESAPKQDYSSMPLLAAPPQVGQKIAFKLLELSESYTPEISEYKEGRIMSFDPTTKQIELELFHASQAPVEPGKFDLVYQNPDGSETVEYAVSRAAWVTERWDSLLEPRLII